MSTLFLLGLVTLCLVANSLFVAAEYALVTIRKSRLEEMVKNGVAGARTIQALKAGIERAIAGSQLGISFSSLTMGMIGSSFVLAVDGVLLNALYLHSQGSSELAFWLSFGFLSVVQVVVAEQIPKQIALRLPEQTLLRLYKPFMVFCLVMSPLIWLMSFTSGLALKLFGIAKITPQGHHQLPSPDELQILFDQSEKAGTIDKQESDLLRRALDLKDLTVREVMVPRPHMDCITESMPLAEIVKVICQTKHSKLPVYRGDTVIGILNTRDLFDVWSTHLKSTGTPPVFKLNANMRKAYFVPVRMQASALLEEMKERRLQMAIAVDEFGTTVGLITLEDLIEQLVGEIWDEYDKPSSAIQAVGENTWHVQGELTLFEFNKAFEVHIACSHCTTVAGAVIEALERQPNIGETASMGGFSLRVLEMNGPAITKLEVKRLDTGDPPSPAGNGADSAAKSS
jgi:CBS domain containing-hemolysin-like protein